MFKNFGGNSVTSTIEYLFDRDKNTEWSKNVFSGGSSFDIILDFGTTTVVDGVMFRNSNFYDLAISAANTTTVDTATSFTNISGASVAANSEAFKYIGFSATTLTAIRLTFTPQSATTSELNIGELIVANRLVECERNPTTQNYKNQLFRKQIRHEMPDGGTKLFNIKDKFRAKLTWAFITENFKDELFELFEGNEAYVFIPFPTTTGWDGDAFETVIVGPFDFNYGANTKSVGWNGSLSIEETPGA